MEFGSRSQFTGESRWARSAARLLVLGFAGVSELSAASSPWFETPEARVRFLSAWEAAPVGEADARLGLEFELRPGWHVYWKNPGDAGYPPAVELEPAAAVRLQGIRYPPPERFELPGGLESIGYAGTVVYPLDAGLTAGDPGSLSLGARLDFLVCAETCIPYRADLAFELPRTPVPRDDPEPAAVIRGWRERLPLPAAQLASTLQATLERLPPSEPGDRAVRLELRLAGRDLKLLAPALFLESLDGWRIGRPELHFLATGLAFRVTLLPERSPAPPGPETLAWTATGIELAGAPVAVEGVARVPEVADALPRPGVRGLLPWLLGVAAGAALVLGAAKWRRRA